MQEKKFRKVFFCSHNFFQNKIQISKICVNYSDNNYNQNNYNAQKTKSKLKIDNKEGGGKKHKLKQIQRI